jgi:alpha-L-fucosidase 2
MDGLIARTEGDGLRYKAAMLFHPEGGRSENGNAGTNVRDANAVTVVLALATSFVNYHDISGDPSDRCRKVLDAVAGKDFATLLRRHVDDFRGLMGRVHLNVGDVAANEKPTDERLRAVRAGGTDPNLEALCFQFGRYILAASSRAGGQPANLQGIWNEVLLPPWGSKYTANINLQMNYWPAEVCNLAECHQPLFELTRDLSETGARTARTQYNLGGWVLHHNTDLWRGTAPVDAAKYGTWPVGGAWLCHHLWEHYAFGGDPKFLREYYPVMRGSAEFLLGLLAEDPKHHWLVTPVSMSPEHSYFDKDGQAAVLSPGPTMDIALIRELFSNCIEAQRILGTDRDFGIKLADAMKRLPPYRIGTNGTVQEWIEDWVPGPESHNVSPLYPFYPGNDITLRGNPGLANAYLKWMEAHPTPNGFQLAWSVAMWARLEHGEKAGALVQRFLSRNPADNLHNRGNNQSDASFGLTAAIAETLLQSHAGEISLLPALMPQWPNGSVTGLRARGGFEVDMAWRDGKLTEGVIRSRDGGAVRLRYGPVIRETRLAKGETYRWNRQ